MKPKQDRCLVYSFGQLGETVEGSEWVLEDQFAVYGCQVYAFDPKANNNASRSANNSRIHFHNWGLGNRDHVGGEGAWQIKSLDSIYNLLSKLHGNRLK